jgi:hypothetical protein
LTHLGFGWLSLGCRPVLLADLCPRGSSGLRGRGWLRLGGGGLGGASVSLHQHLDGRGRCCGRQRHRHGCQQKDDLSAWRPGQPGNIPTVRLTTGLREAISKLQFEPFPQRCVAQVAESLGEHVFVTDGHLVPLVVE